MKKLIHTTHPLLKIEWLDAYASLEDAKTRHFLQVSVGFKAEETKEYIRLAQNLTDGQPNAPYMHIVKSTIISKCQS